MKRSQEPLGSPKNDKQLELNFLNPKFNVDSSRSSDTIVLQEAKAHKDNDTVILSTGHASDTQSMSQKSGFSGFELPIVSSGGTMKAETTPRPDTGTTTTTNTTHEPFETSDCSGSLTASTLTSETTDAGPKTPMTQTTQNTTATNASLSSSSYGVVRAGRYVYKLDNETPKLHFFYEEHQPEESPRHEYDEYRFHTDEDYLEDFSFQTTTTSTQKEDHYKEFYEYQKYADIPIRLYSVPPTTCDSSIDDTATTNTDVTRTIGRCESTREQYGSSKNCHEPGVKIAPKHPTLQSSVQPKPAETRPNFDKPNQDEAKHIPTFAEAGFGMVNEDDWEYVKHPNKMLAHEYILNMVREGSNPDVKVFIGKNAKFKCHSIVLKAYSELCKDLPDMGEIHMNEKSITPQGFVCVYEWMINDRANFEFDGIIEFYEAAVYMKIPALVKQIWEYLDDCQRFSEERACLTYLSARERNIDLVAEIMLRRINKFFIIFVSTLEFLNINVSDLAQLLASPLLSVNTEIEVFMVAVYWLNHNWPARREHAVEVMNSIRFSIMPTLYIVNLHTKMRICPEVKRCIEHKDIEQMIYGGFMVGHIDKQDPPPPVEEFGFGTDDDKPLTRSDERKWIYDKSCEYHHTARCINKHLLTYDAFVRHVQKVSAGGDKYYNAMDIVSANLPGLRCCDGPKLK